MITFSSRHSGFESPILSESRVMNRSIRGDSSRRVEYSEIQTYYQPKQEDSDDATLLSIENTKLRQKITALEQMLKTSY